MNAAVPVVVVIVSGVAYHLAQRGSGSANPWTMLSVAYAAALALTMALGLSSVSSPLGRPTKEDWVAGLVIGLAAFGVEAGFYFVYRAGWPLASVSVIASLASTAILALIGTALLGEHLSGVRAAGIVLAGVAAMLIARG